MERYRRVMASMEKSFPLNHFLLNRDLKGIVPLFCQVCSFSLETDADTHSGAWIGCSSSRRSNTRKLRNKHVALLIFKRFHTHKCKDENVSLTPNGIKHINLTATISIYILIFQYRYNAILGASATQNTLRVGFESGQINF